MDESGVSPKIHKLQGSFRGENFWTCAFDGIDQPKFVICRFLHNLSLPIWMNLAWLEYRTNRHWTFVRGVREKIYIFRDNMSLWFYVLTHLDLVWRPVWICCPTWRVDWLWREYKNQHAWPRGCWFRNSLSLVRLGCTHGCWEDIQCRQIPSDHSRSACSKHHI